MTQNWREQNPGDTLGKTKYLKILDEAIERSKSIGGGRRTEEDSRYRLGVALKAFEDVNRVPTTDYSRFSPFKPKT